ncbi:MAG: hypothetical protein M1815_006246 [Lichina confinis]|nr:MAG: hypothetical protein M1815_006246 [Lichina confinis]
MPVHPSEENVDATAGSITDQVAKNPSSTTESSASDHPAHQGDDSSGKVRATAEHFKAAPGPALPQDDIGQPASKEELRARAEELNK